MISIGTVKFDFQASNELFVQDLYKRWDYFFETHFEKVMSDVLRFYDQENEMITIESFPVDLGVLQEENFDRQFEEKLRQALLDYLREYLDRKNDSQETVSGIRRITMGRNALETLSFYLLHGYFPYHTEAVFANPAYLLELVITTETYRFREFLEAYGHYEFLYRRLVFQFTDEELEKIVCVVQPSESKFVNLYARIQINAYISRQKTLIGRNDYRNIVWILILAYLLSETQGRFDRKQLVMHTICGMAAHLNLSFENLLLLLTDELDKLERKVEQLPELWSILKELRTEVRGSLQNWQRKSTDYLMAELISFLRLLPKENNEEFFLKGPIIRILADSRMCHELLGSLDEREIHRIIEILIPLESDFVISYALLLERNKENTTLSGKAGSEFRLLKWELILASLVAMPASMFARKQFVLSVLQRLAAHYNLDVIELIRFFSSMEEWKDTFLSRQILSVLAVLSEELIPNDSNETVWTELPEEEIEIVLCTPFLSRRLLEGSTDRQIGEWVKKVMPVQGEFIVAYACFLNESHVHGLLEGKAGSEFRVLKWEFIFACLLGAEKGTFQQKNFIYSVLQQLAAHYNQKVLDLLCYFFREQTAIMEALPFAALRMTLKELYEESMLPLAKLDVVRDMSVEDMQYWLLCLFGEKQRNVSVKEEYLEKWLIFLLNDRNEVFRRLWKTGRLDTVRILSLVNRNASLQHLWLRRIGDGRLSQIYEKWRQAFNTWRDLSSSLFFLNSLSEYIRFWMVELTARNYLGWSETEVEKFLVERMSKNIPAGFMTLIEKSYNKNIDDLIEKINELKKKGVFMETVKEKFLVENAGLMLCAPFFYRLFGMVGLLNDERRSFKDEGSQIRAIFMLQYLVYGNEREWSESELILNKLIVGFELEKPLLNKVELVDKEKEIINELVQAIGQMWDKLKHTSIEAIRMSFLQRKGFVTQEERQGFWMLKVEEKPYDILLDSIPWNFRLFKASWGNTLIETKWRE